jgi:hypothetical protein
VAAVYERAAVKAYSRLLGHSFARLTGRALVPGIDPSAPDFSRALFHAPQHLVSHGTQIDPIFRYANRAALTLWEMDWDAFTRLASRHSAAPDATIQADRDRFLSMAAQQGFVEGYEGTRVSASGRRFVIRQTVLWTVCDDTGHRHGQAALIGHADPTPPV